ncbi:hypothetical protein Tco_0519467, partial [Tanacetum coccineum]
EVKTASTPIETQKPLLKDENGKEMDVHMYSSMIGSLMYLTSSRPDIMFAVCACARYQLNLKVSHLHDVKRIFRYLKGQPKLGLWYPKDSPFDLVTYTDSDYAGASLDRKSTTGARVESSGDEESFGEDASKQERLMLIDADEEITLGQNENVVEEVVDVAQNRVGRGKEKRAGTDLAQEVTKKQKVEDDKETTEIKKLMEIILDEEEVAIDAIPLAVKSPSICLY